MKNFLVLLFGLMLAGLAIASNHEQGDCNLVIEYYPWLGNEFGKFLLEKNKNNDQKYEEKFYHYLAELTRWHAEYQKCKTHLTSKTKSMSKDQHKSS